MNKKLLVLAMGAALVATAGVASADVSWYGKANIALRSGDIPAANTENDGADADTDTTKTIDLAGGGSRIGINASEDLGNGIKAAYWHEWSLNTADGRNPGDNTGNFGHRDNLFSLSGSFGTFGAGALAMPSKVIGAGKLDLFGDTVGDVNDNGMFYQPAGAQVRYGNKVGDLSFTIAYGPDNTAEDTSSTDANVIYSSGPLAAGLGYHNSGDNYHASAAVDTLTNLFVSYTMDNMMFLGGYQKASDINAADSGIDSTTWTLGANIGFGGGNNIIAQYANRTADNDLGRTTTAVGFEHAMSKNLGVGVHYATVTYEDETASGAEDGSAWDAGFSFKF